MIRKLELNDEEKEIMKHVKLDEMQQLRLKKILLAKNFCKMLTHYNIKYDFWINHSEVLGCDMSRIFYQKYKSEIGSKYSICKNIFIQEKNNGKCFLIIVDDTKKIDLKSLRELLQSRKLEFSSEQNMMRLLNTTPGNVSIFNSIYDTNNEISIVIDEDLLTYDLLAFHPLYNGMSIFLKPQETFKFLHLIKHNYFISAIPEKQDIISKPKTLVKGIV